MKSLITTCLLSFLAAPVFAAEDPSAEEIFALLCHRKPPASMAGDDLKLRQEFQQFLRSPRLTARGLERALSSKNKDIGDSIAELFTYSSTCHLVDTYAADLKAKGCLDGKGKRLPVNLSIKLCAPIADKFKKASAKVEKENEEAEAVNRNSPSEPALPSHELTAPAL
jgi:hypothetical protein